MDRRQAKHLDELHRTRGTNYRRFACTYMSDRGHIFGYVIADSTHQAIGQFLAMIEKAHGTGYDLNALDGGENDDGDQAFAMGEHWCVQVVGLEWLVKALFPTDQVALIRGTGKSKLP